VPSSKPWIKPHNVLQHTATSMEKISTFKYVI
jgi:hypothetical protein